MSNYSERKLQELLHSHGFYTQKAPSSGHGILDPETEEYIDQADIVAIQYVRTPKAGIGMGKTVVLILEDKHVKPPTCPIEDQEVEQVKRIQEITHGKVYFAVNWKNKHGGHHFYSIGDLQDTGMHWKITEDQDGKGIEDVLP